VMAGQARHFAGPYRFELVPGASHFLQREQPQAVTDLILDWFAGLSAAAELSGPATKPSSDIDMWQVVSGTANLLSDCGLQAVVQTVAGDGRGFSREVCPFTAPGVCWSLDWRLWGRGSASRVWSRRCRW
jgi:hypothetical protein